MAKKLSNMTIEELEKEISIYISSMEVFDILKDSETTQKYYELQKQMQKKYEFLEENAVGQENDEIEDRRDEEIIDFIKNNSDKIDKRKLVLLVLNHYMQTAKMLISQVSKYGKTIIELMEANVDPATIRTINVLSEHIEKAKQLLDDEPEAVIFKEEFDKKTDETVKITEMSSIDLCADDSIPKKLLFGREMSEKQKAIYDRRKKRYEKKEKEKQRKILNNKQVLGKIADHTDLYYFFQLVQIADLKGVFITNDDLGNILKDSVVKNLILRLDPNSSVEKISDSLEKDEFNEYFTSIVDSPYTSIKETFEILKNHLEYLDMDKLLLCLAYREREYLEAQSDEEQRTTSQIEGIYSSMTLIEDLLKNRNPKLSANMISLLTHDYEQCEYSRRELSQDLEEKFVDEVYLNNYTIEKAKEALKSGEGKFEDYSPYFLFKLGLSTDELCEIIVKSPENMHHFVTATVETDDGIAPAFACSQKDFEELVELSQKIYPKTVIAMLGKSMIDQDDVTQLVKKNKITINELIDLIKDGEIESRILIDSIIELDEEKITEEDKQKALEIIGEDELKLRKEKRTLDNSFLNYYFKLAPLDEEKKEEYLSKLKTILLESQDEVSVKWLYEKDLLQSDEYEKIDEYTIMELVENDDDVNKIFELYNDGVLDKDSFVLLISERFSDEELINYIDEGKVEIEPLFKSGITINDDNVIQKYEDGKYKSSRPAIWSLATGNLSIEELENLYKKEFITEDELFEYAKKGIFDPKIIKNLYINSLLSDEELDQLTQENIISQTAANMFKNLLSMNQIAENIDSSLGFEFDENNNIKVEEIDFVIEPPKEKQIEGDGDLVPKPHNPSPTNDKMVINPHARELKFRMMGAVKISQENIKYDEASPFNNYEFYVIPNAYGLIDKESVVIAERFYKDKFTDDKKLAPDNATYLFKLKDLARFSKKGKTEILEQMNKVTDRGMKRALHSKNWARNLDRKVAEMMGKKLQSIYTNEELAKINKLNEIIDKDRIFDVPVLGNAPESLF